MLEYSHPSRRRGDISICNICSVQRAVFDWLRGDYVCDGDGSKFECYQDHDRIALRETLGLEIHCHRMYIRQRLQSSPQPSGTTSRPQKLPTIHHVAMEGILHRDSDKAIRTNIKPSESSNRPYIAMS